MSTSCVARCLYEGLHQLVDEAALEDCRINACLHQGKIAKIEFSSTYTDWQGRRGATPSVAGSPHPVCCPTRPDNSRRRDPDVGPAAPRPASAASPGLHCPAPECTAVVEGVRTCLDRFLEHSDLRYGMIEIVVSGRTIVQISFTVPIRTTPSWNTELKEFCRFLETRLSAVCRDCQRAAFRRGDP